MPKLHESAHSTSSRLLGLLGLAGLVLPTALLAGCDSGDGLDAEPEHITLRPAEFDAPTPSFALAISLAGEDVALDWSGSQGDAVSVFRSSDPALLASLPLNGALPAGVVEVVLDESATDYTDAGAADQDQSTPTYYYRVGIESDGERVLSRLVMKTTTAMAPGYNKFGMCMLEGPTRASDVVSRLGSSVVGVWGWDAVNQSYISWTPAQGVGTDADFPIGFGGVFAAQVDGSTPSFQSLVGVVPTNESFAVTGQPGYNWTTLPVGYDGPATASYWVDQVGYWGMGTWSNLAQSASWYWNSNYADFGLEACQPYYMYLPDNACTSNDDCGEDNFCYFVDPAACGDVAAGLCKAQPMGCEFAPVGEVCGCDDVTYASACEAEQAGASVASEGACEVVDPCEGNSCVNGDCIDLGDDYACACASGWTGANCDVEIDECASSPCINGDCIDLVDDYACACAPGFTGGDCEVEIDECLAEPCVNGECIDQVNDYECTCDPGWTGANCDEVPGICDSNPCANGGECIENADGSNFTCVCASGFTGADCTTAYDACGGEVDDLGSTVPQSVVGISLDGLNDDLNSACSNAGGPDRAYTFTAPTAGGYRFDTFGSGGDPVLAVLNDCGGPELSCNDDTVDVQSQIDIVMEAGETVTILLDTFNPPAAGTLFQLNVSEVVIDESVCGCFSDSLIGSFTALLVDAPLACSADGNSISGINPFVGLPDRVFIGEAFGRSFCQSDLITAFIGPRRVLLSDTQAQSCRDLFAQAASNASLVCE